MGKIIVTMIIEADDIREPTSSTRYSVSGKALEVRIKSPTWERVITEGDNGFVFELKYWGLKIAKP